MSYLTLCSSKLLNFVDMIELPLVLQVYNYLSPASTCFYNDLIQQSDFFSIWNHETYLFVIL